MWFWEDLRLIDDKTKNLLVKFDQELANHITEYGSKTVRVLINRLKEIEKNTKHEMVRIICVGGNSLPYKYFKMEDASEADMYAKKIMNMYIRNGTYHYSISYDQISIPKDELEDYLAYSVEVNDSFHIEEPAVRPIGYL